MIISEKKLHKIISECISTYMSKKSIRESFDNFDMNIPYEAKKKDSDDGREADFRDEDGNEQEKRSQVESFFKKDGVDIAPYAYRLYGVEVADGEDTNDMKNARGKFMKCLNHEENSAGYPYSFTSAEINKLSSLISSDNQLNEGAETRGGIAGAALGAYYGGIKGMSAGYQLGKEVGKVVDNIKDDIKNDLSKKKSEKNECVKLTESQLNKLISEAISEIFDTVKGAQFGEKLANRAAQQGRYGTERSINDRLNKAAQDRYGFIGMNHDHCYYYNERGNVIIINRDGSIRVGSTSPGAEHFDRPNTYDLASSVGAQQLRTSDAKMARKVAAWCKDNINPYIMIEKAPEGVDGNELYTRICDWHTWALK